MGSPHKPETRARKRRLAHFILKACAARGLRPGNEINEALGISTSNASSWRRGASVPAKSIETLEEVLTALRCGGTCPSMGQGHDLPPLTFGPPPKNGYTSKARVKWDGKPSGRRRRASASGRSRDRVLA